MLIYIALDEIEPGTCLGMDLLDAQGRLLLAKGVALSEKLLAVLKRQEIERVPVEEERSAGWVDDQRRHIQSTVEQRFQGVTGHPLMAELKRIVLRHRLEVLR